VAITRYTERAMRKMIRRGFIAFLILVALCVLWQIYQMPREPLHKSLHLYIYGADFDGTGWERALWRWFLDKLPFRKLPFTP
jgi:hypothetical protein